MLEQEGLVVSHPYRGAVVVDISQEEIAEILVPVRTVIEKVASARRRARRTPRSSTRSTARWRRWSARRTRSTPVASPTSTSSSTRR
nr:hypothetical protein [Cellulosimicrobium sp. MM]